ncbi:CidA/LrgA family protein [Microbacter margulisiae]|uniref:Holin-like protein n=1 Tax=Microbacter margulisiae TaxID=1350067 RepID=A0A7W5H180_9PORP|nr:CidA/LrgA family protein [Microbacter margulisiae]MBB3187308.1 holin-like protein [Microbacter margulisiae]
MAGILILLLFYLAGDLLSLLIGNFIPGSVLGMLLLFVALVLKIVKPVHIHEASRFLLDNMMLFFIPVGVGLMTSYVLIGKYIVAIVVAAAISTILVISVVGWLAQKLEKRHS